jgi:hypothetical protein
MSKQAWWVGAIAAVSTSAPLVACDVGEVSSGPDKVAFAVSTGGFIEAHVVDGCAPPPQLTVTGDDFSALGFATLSGGPGGARVLERCHLRARLVVPGRLRIDRVRVVSRDWVLGATASGAVHLGVAPIRSGQPVNVVTAQSFLAGDADEELVDELDRDTLPAWTEACAVESQAVDLDVGFGYELFPGTGGGSSGIDAIDAHVELGPCPGI